MADLKRKKRNPLAIQRDILLAAKNSAGVTQIVYQTNLNFKAVRPYLKELIDRGFLSTVTNNNTYQTTPQGLSFARRFTKLEAKA